MSHPTSLPRRELSLYGETYGTRWSDSPLLSEVFYAEPPTELDPMGVAGDDWPQEDTDALVGPLRREGVEIDREALESWYEGMSDCPY